jgi:transcriptional regulator with XRE-family HTH domain
LATEVRAETETGEAVQDTPHGSDNEIVQSADLIPLQDEGLDDAGGISAFLKARRGALSQGAVAQRAGLSIDWYRQIEQGRARNISTDVLSRIAQALNLSTQDAGHLATLAMGRGTGIVPAPQPDQAQGAGQANEARISRDVAEDRVVDVRNIASYLTRHQVSPGASEVVRAVALSADVAIRSVVEAHERDSDDIILIEGDDEIGLLQAWAGAISAQRVGIRMAAVVAEGRQAKGCFILDSPTPAQLAKIKKRLTADPRVHRVS